MKFKMNMLFATALMVTSCSHRPDSTTSLYAFEAAEAARKNWITSPDKPLEDTLSVITEHQVDSVQTDTLIENLQN